MRPRAVPVTTACQVNSFMWTSSGTYGLCVSAAGASEVEAPGSRVTPDVGVMAVGSAMVGAPGRDSVDCQLDSRLTRRISRPSRREEIAPALPWRMMECGAFPGAKGRRV